MESANEKKEHWLMIDVNKFINSIDLNSLEKDNLQLLQELLNQYNELLTTNTELEIRIEKNMRIQKKITLGFFLSFILFEIYIIYFSSNPYEPVRIKMLVMMILTAAFIWRLKPGP